MRDAVGAGVAAHQAEQLASGGIAVLVAPRRGRDDVVLRRHGEFRMQHPAAGPREPFEGLRARRLLKNMPVDEHEVAPVVQPLHQMGGPDLLEEDRKSTRELQSLMRISYAVFCLKKKK